MQLKIFTICYCKNVVEETIKFYARDLAEAKRRAKEVLIEKGKGNVTIVDVYA